MLKITNLVRTGIARVWSDPPTAGSLWDVALGSDWPAWDCGLDLLDGLNAADHAVVTTVLESSLPVGGGYQRPQISRVEVGGRTLWLSVRGCGEGYLHFLTASQDAAVEAMPIGCSWRRLDGGIDTITDEEIRSERQRAVRAGEHDLADLCEVALGQHDQNGLGGLHDPYTGVLIERSTARARVAAAINDRSVLVASQDADTAVEPD